MSISDRSLLHDRGDQTSEFREHRLSVVRGVITLCSSLEAICIHRKSLHAKVLDHLAVDYFAEISTRIIMK